ncbi:prepilin-type N-terminal cleavage/methylation domain-containing protein [Pseudokineococcus basanitobsidens]|uniref:Prepilin-type N-terminal cleavage/methylation domain-containing protein n=1 Tax=Pseudokineococcus basanitobsidens TaxID=1926649 RepID=A0ABU8RI09_9ACTN
MLARIRKSVEEKDAGFTLVELLVVMIIIGILAAIAIPVFLNQRQKANDTSIKSDLRTVATQVETAFVDTQAYPTQAAYANYSSVTGIGTAQTTTGNTIQYKSIANGFCLRGSTTNPSTAKGPDYFFYDSTTGGLKTGAAAATSGSC